MDESILKTIKQALGLAEDYTPFDFEITMHINTVLATLHQLGVGPTDSLTLNAYETKWSDLLDTDVKLNGAQSYIFMKVRMIFDPPGTQYAVAAYEERIKEEEWRLTVAADPMTRQVGFQLDPETGSLSVIDSRDVLEAVAEAENG